MNLFDGRIPLHMRKPKDKITFSATSGRLICTKGTPFYQAGEHARWHHPDARETDADSDYYIEYRCPNCGIVFRTEMPD
jgi:hypothetical protein